MPQIVAMITVDETRDVLAKHFADFLLSNPNELISRLRNGTLDTFPDLNSATDDDIIQLAKDNRVGESPQFETFDSVAVVKGNSLVVIYEVSKKQVHPVPGSPGTMPIGGMGIDKFVIS